jgi:hypothetical protein
MSPLPSQSEPPLHVYCGWGSYLPLPWHHSLQAAADHASGHGRPFVAWVTPAQDLPTTTTKLPVWAARWRHATGGGSTDCLLVGTCMPYVQKQGQGRGPGAAGHSCWPVTAASLLPLARQEPARGLRDNRLLPTAG